MMKIKVMNGERETFTEARREETIRKNDNFWGYRWPNSRVSLHKLVISDNLFYYLLK